MAYVTVGNIQNYYGLAADTKPTLAASQVGYRLYELDTDTTYIWDGSAWQAQASVSVTLNAGDVEIGAVEIKNATDDTRAVVKTDGTNNALVVTQNTQPLPTGASTAAAQATSNTALAAIQVAAEIIDDWDESDRAKVNLIASQAGITGGAGAVAANTPRTTLASDDPAVASLSVLDDWDESDRAKVNIVVGQAGVTAGAGAVAANTQRVTLASDDPGVASLSVIDDWDESDRAKVNPIAGQAGVQGGSGTVTALTQRVVLATDVAPPLPVSGVTVTLTPTMSASPDYSAGDGLGGIQTIASVVASNGLSALLKSVCVSDKAGQAPQISIYFFKATPAAGTYTDNDALAWGAGDAVNMIGIVKLVTADYKTVGGVSTACLSDIDQLHTPSATSVFAIIEVDATYNGASTSDLNLVFGYERR